MKQRQTLHNNKLPEISDSKAINNNKPKSSVVESSHSPALPKIQSPIMKLDSTKPNRNKVSDIKVNTTVINKEPTNTSTKKTVQNQSKKLMKSSQSKSIVDRSIDKKLNKVATKTNEIESSLNNINECKVISDTKLNKNEAISAHLDDIHSTSDTSTTIVTTTQDNTTVNHVNKDTLLNGHDNDTNSLVDPVSSLSISTSIYNVTESNMTDLTIANIHVTSSPLPSLSESIQDTIPPCVPIIPVYNPIIDGTGQIQIKYELYEEYFPICNGILTQQDIDDVYCLSYVMPNCHIYLSIYNPSEHRERYIAYTSADSTDTPTSSTYMTTPSSLTNIDLLSLYIKEEPIGTYIELHKDSIYYAYVLQQADQLLLDQQKMKQYVNTYGNLGNTGNSSSNDIIRDDSRMGMESCSCIYGNPCVDEYGCKNWDNRYAIATKNGWKGF